MCIRDRCILLGSYTVTLNDVNYYAILSYKDIDTGLRALNVVVAWDQQGSQFGFPVKSFKLTTYVSRADEYGGEGG